MSTAPPLLAMFYSGSEERKSWVKIAPLVHEKVYLKLVFEAKGIIYRMMGFCSLPFNYPICIRMFNSKGKCTQYRNLIFRSLD